MWWHWGMCVHACVSQLMSHLSVPMMPITLIIQRVKRFNLCSSLEVIRFIMLCFFCILTKSACMQLQFWKILSLWIFLCAMGARFVCVLTRRPQQHSYHSQGKLSVRSAGCALAVQPKTNQTATCTSMLFNVIHLLSNCLVSECSWALVTLYALHWHLCSNWTCNWTTIILQRKGNCFATSYWLQHSMDLDYLILPKM